MVVSGAGGRLGSAIIGAAAARGLGVVPWRRPDFDLDAPASAGALLDRDRPSCVIHAAAWTDVNGCARDPELAMRRNAEATDVLARACAAAGVPLVVISTNEVFDGARDDGRGYREDDPPAPRNPYGASKLAGERAAQAAFGGSPGLLVVRVVWLFGPPGDDFPHRIVRAADRLPAGEPLPVVSDEHGCPTYTRDLAVALLDVLERTDGGILHLAGGGRASRLDWATAVLATLRPERPVRPMRGADFVRDSDVPPWGVLDTERAAALGVRLRPWAEALQAYLGAEP